MDSERGRDSRRKKYSSRDKEKEPPKRMVILTKSKEPRNEDPPPTLLLKNRDTERAVSPQAPKEDGQLYQLATRNPTSARKGSQAALPQMKESVKFLDNDSLTVSDNVLEYLSDTSDFLVVGCIGQQGVGKSTIMSHLADPASINNPERMVFKVQTPDHVDTNSHCTEGIQCFITNHRVILLDVQPVLSFSVVAKYHASEGAGLAVRSVHRDGPDHPCIDNDVDILFLQYIAFVLSVCHVVVVVQDYCFDPDLIRFLLTAEMLKPPCVHDEETTEHYPHCVFVQNVSPQRSFLNLKVKHMQDTYKAAFSGSQLIIQSGMGMSNGVFMPSLCPELCGGDPINLFLLPERRAPHRKLAYEAKEYDEIIDLLRCHIHGVPVMQLTHTSLSEKNWLQYAMKMWEDIKKSPLFLDYGRMLPTASSFKVDQ